MSSGKSQSMFILLVYLNTCLEWTVNVAHHESLRHFNSLTLTIKSTNWHVSKFEREIRDASTA